jgi:hypothetical protein
MKCLKIKVFFDLWREADGLPEARWALLGPISQDAPLTPSPRIPLTVWAAAAALPGVL